MLKLLNRAALLVLALLPAAGHLSAADDDDDIEAPIVRELTNQAYMTGFRQFCQAKGARVQEFGRGTVRLFTGGKVDIDAEKAKELIEAGETVVQGLEIWTAKQDMFVPRTKSEADAYCMVVLESESMFDEFLAFVRQRGTAKTPDGHEDLTKAYKVLTGPRCCIMPAKKFMPIAKNWMAHKAASLALGTYYYERGQSVPIWLSVGINAEMERMLCGRIAIFTVSYEKNKNATDGANAQGNWGRDFAELLKKGPQTELQTAHQAMSMDLVGMSYNQYIQLWSIGSFIRAATARGSKRKNKFAKIIKRTAAGEDDADVVLDIFGESDRNLTIAWHRWAMSQRN